MKDYTQMLKFIKERFERYQTYHQILGIKSDNLTDEIVKDAYDKRCREMNLMLEDCEEGNEKVQEIKAIMQSAFDDAYAALKDENARKHYQEVLDYIEKQKGEER